MDCGCTSTSSFSGGSAKRKWASISSRPLFISVALSTEIFAPIDQLGCATACSTVAPDISANVLSRKGPPDAVRMTFSTSLAPSPFSTWKTALCSESTGMTAAVELASARPNTPPAATMHSLLASATVALRAAAASAGLGDEVVHPALRGDRLDRHGVLTIGLAGMRHNIKRADADGAGGAQH